MQDTTEPEWAESGQIYSPTPLPCLNSNISIEAPPEQPGGGEGESARTQFAALSTQHRKSAFVLKESVQKLANLYGLAHIGMLTLTFREHILCPKEAQRRLNSLISNVIKSRYHDYVGVMERQKSGRIHYHLLIALDSDIRTGISFVQVANGDYRSAPSNLRHEWSHWRTVAPKYGFGRTELLPIRTSTEAIAKYVGKYISKHMEVRNPEDKGVRLVRYSNGARAGTTRFQFHSQGSKDWRRKVATFAQIVQHKNPHEKVNTLEDLSRVLGKRWAYRHRDYILALP